MRSSKADILRRMLQAAERDVTDRLAAFLDRGTDCVTGAPDPIAAALRLADEAERVSSALLRYAHTLRRVAHHAAPPVRDESGTMRAAS